MEHKHLVSSKRLLCRYFIPVLMLFCMFAESPHAGSPGPIQLTDGGADRLVYYFDTRMRKSYIQLANLSASPVSVHVQIWIVNGFIDCEEIDFFDDYSGKDVHTYDMSAVAGNDTPSPISSPSAGTYGFVVISRSSGPANSLTGTMRIIDDAGHEYRANAATPESASTDASAEGIINFSNSNGHSSSEVIGFTYVEFSADTVIASPTIRSVFGTLSSPNAIQIHDEFENDFSCVPREFNCSDGNANIAIDNSLTNTKSDPNRVCDLSIISPSNDSGYLRMPFEQYICTDLPPPLMSSVCPTATHFVGFVGLTNGTGSAVFDSWWEGGLTP